ncbi:rod shape-determining protein MreC [Nonomuraea sp. NBC_01738]|uniref:rod shape-determining protein MreC n=1 Tax=Nonomuraea sp. NBC_01738 TaxID=2976003 RepID=UPI002E15C9EC|nr:rod shape-determining protein MreC [Nonomuraea sp. NBC_01738]
MRAARRARRVVIALVLCAALLIAIDTRSPLRPLLTAGAAVAGPVQRALAGLTSGGDGADRIRLLEQDNARLKAELRSRTGPALAVPPGYVGAQVIAYGGRQGYTDTVTIDAGSSAGVRPDQAVVNGDGLVGRVIATGPATATVLLASDATAVTGARLTDSGEAGTVTGGGRDSGLLTLTLLGSDAEVEPGGQVVTFGSRRMVPYPPGIPIGTVTSVERGADPLTRTALLRPAVRFTALDAVVVVIPPAAPR